MGLAFFTSLAFVCFNPKVSAAANNLEVSLSAPDSCGSSAQLNERIESRARTLYQPQNQGIWRVFVQIQPTEDNSLKGTLQLSAPNGGQVNKSIEGTDCAEILDAMALVVALNIDGVGTQEDDPPPKPKVEKKPIPAPNPPPTVPQSPIGKPARTSNRWRWQTGLHGGFMGVIAPTISPHGGVFVDAFAPNNLESILHFTLQHARSVNVHTADGDAHFVSTTVRTLICPTQWPKNYWFSFAPCGGLEIGIYDATGSNAPNASSVTQPWITWALSGRIGLNLPGPFTAFVEPGAIIPLLRDRYYFDPSGVTAHQPPIIGPFLSVGFGVKMP